MPVERTKLGASVWLVVGLFLGVLGGIGFSKITMEVKPKVNPADIPRKLVNVTIDQSQQDELFTQLRRFADKWGYAIRIAPVVPNDNTVLHVGLWRIDIKAIGAYLVDSRTLQIAFSYTESRRPVPERYFDEEVNDLKNFIDKIPNATFTISK